MMALMTEASAVSTLKIIVSRIGALRDERVTSVLIGASSVGQLEANVGALANLTFTSDELAEIDKYAVDSDINLWASSSSY